MFQFLEFVGCIVLWIIGTVRTITKKKPLFVLALFGLHLFETVTIGVKTGLKYGKTLPESIANCLCFGFTWWLPLKQQMKEETFTDEDFVRTPDDCIVED